jgi:hypothetical protein
MPASCTPQWRFTVRYHTQVCPDRGLGRTQGNQCDGSEHSFRAQTQDEKCADRGRGRLGAPQVPGAPKTRTVNESDVGAGRG